MEIRAEAWYNIKKTNSRAKNIRRKNILEEIYDRKHSSGKYAAYNHTGSRKAIHR